SVTSVAPVASVFASSAIATLPPLRCSRMMPEPTTAASSSAVPSSSPVRRRARVMSNSLARSNPRVFRAHKGAHELVFYERRDRVHIEALAGQELSRIFDAVNSGRFNVDRFEARFRQPLYVIRFFERPRDAADP